ALTPFVERFNGTKWSLSGLPAATGSDVMIGVNGISVISDSDAWMVAFQDINGQDGQGEAFHFDGTHWRLFPTPAVASSTLRAGPAGTIDDYLRSRDSGPGQCLGRRNLPRKTGATDFRAVRAVHEPGAIEIPKRGVV